jgi:hypothetical protein
VKLESLIVVLSALAFASPMRGQGTGLDSLRVVHAEAVRLAAALAGERARTAGWAEEQYARIPEARQADAKTLRVALRDAQRAADSLAVLDTFLEVTLSAEGEARGALAAALEAALEETLIEAEYAEAERKTILTERARRLAIELTSMQQSLALPSAELPNVTVDPSDGPEEIALKADFLDDRAVQLRNAAEVIDDEMERMRRQGQLHDEMRRLVAEVRLFDQLGVPPAVAEVDQADDGSPAEQSPLIDPQDFDGQIATARLPADVAVSATGEPALEVSVSPVERGIDAPPDRRTLMERLTRLRAELVLRAVALERQAEEVRRQLEEPPDV